MELGLRGKRALVTGGRRGLGRAIGEGLIEEGCGVVMTSRDPETLRAAADAIKKKHDVAIEIVPADLSREDEVARVAAAAQDVDIS